MGTFFKSKQHDTSLWLPCKQLAGPVLLNRMELEFMSILLQIIVTSQNILLKPGVAVHTCDSSIQEIELGR